MFLSSNKEINRLISKGMSSIYLNFIIEELIFSKLRFSKFKKFVSRLVFGEPQFTQIFKTFCYNIKSKVWEQNCMWLLYYFDFESNYDVKSKIPCILLNKNINFNKNVKNVNVKSHA